MGYNIRNESMCFVFANRRLGFRDSSSNVNIKLMHRDTDSGKSSILYRNNFGLPVVSIHKVNKDATWSRKRVITKSDIIVYT